MPTFTDLLAQGAAHAWLFIPSAILLGALHGLEPGHSKTMMAAFIVAIRGSVKQAILLGLCATISHTLIVWVIALGGMHLWRGVGSEQLEPYFQLATGVIVIGMALWMLWRTGRDNALAAVHDGHHHGHDHSHGHHHDHHHTEGDPREGEWRLVNTGHGLTALEIAEVEGVPKFRIWAERGPTWPAQDVLVETERPDGSRQTFKFVQREDFLESSGKVAEGSRLSEQAGDALKKILEGVEKTAKAIEQISAATEQQGATANEVAKAVENVASITEENASSSEELAASSEELSGSGESLRQMIDEFKVSKAKIKNAR